MVTRGRRRRCWPSSPLMRRRGGTTTQYAKAADALRPIVDRSRWCDPDLLYVGRGPSRYATRVLRLVLLLCGSFLTACIEPPPPAPAPALNDAPTTPPAVDTELP